MPAMVNIQWIEPSEIAVPDELAAAMGGHPLVAQILVRRGLEDLPAAQAFLDPQVYHPTPPGDMPGLIDAVVCLEHALAQGHKILVWGDFDVDGQTATALLTAALRELGGQVIYHVPVRAVESHGISLPVLHQILDHEQPPVGVLLTCDTGISAHEAVAYAQQRGLEVVITDHHELPERLPSARAVVNPRLLPEGSRLTSLPGVGVAYKLVEALYRRAERTGEEAQYLDLVALGIVADVAVQTGETRYLLQRGLQLLRQSQRAGIRAILENAELDPTWLTEEHLAFQLAPRLNAVGRLADANLSVELLTTSDEGRARLLALQLEGLNSQRKLLTSQVYQGALALLAREPEIQNEAVLVLAHPTWPAGVIGIVAARLVERFHKPVVMIATPAGESGRGSARSVAGWNITQALAACQELLAGFGGHAMAAGFAIKPELIPEFRHALARSVEKMGWVSQSTGGIPLTIDGYLPLSELSLELVADLERLAPFGAGNPPVTLACRKMKAIAHAPVGREEEHLIVTVEDEQGNSQRVIWWQSGDRGNELPGGTFDLAYIARASTFRGQRAVQVEWVDFRPVGLTQPPELKPTMAIVADYRQEIHPLALLEPLLETPGIQVWAEGEACARLATRYPGRAALFRDRTELDPGIDLVVWTPPPGPAEWRAALENLHCTQDGGKTISLRVTLFAVQPEADQVETFLQRLVGLLKYSLRVNQGWVNLQKLAAVTAQRAVTVQKGITWLANRGNLALIEREEQRWRVGLANGNMNTGGIEILHSVENDRTSITIMKDLQKLIDESCAFRDYYSRIDKDYLLY